MADTQRAREPRTSVLGSSQDKSVPLNASPADVRTAWLDSFRDEAKPRSGFWTLFWGVLGGLGTLLVVVAVVLFIPRVRAAIGSYLIADSSAVAPSPTSAPLPVTTSESAAVGTLMIEFEGPAPLVMTPGALLGTDVRILVTHGGKPAAGASVRLMIEPGEGNPDVTLSESLATTDQMGRAVVAVYPGSVIGKAKLVAQAGQKRASLPMEVRAQGSLATPISLPQLSPPSPAQRLVGDLTFKPESIDLGEAAVPINVAIIATDSEGARMADQAIAITLVGSGQVSTNQLVSGADGRALFTYTPGEDTQGGTITATSGEKSAVLELLSAPIHPSKIVLAPEAFDLGVSERADVRVSVTSLETGAPLTSTFVTLAVQPAELATIGDQVTFGGATDDANGELTAQLVAAEWSTGVGKVIARLDDGTTIEAPITVRPVANNKTEPNARLYKIPLASQSNLLDEAATGARLPIVGSTKVEGVVWYLVRLPEDISAWTSTSPGDLSAPKPEGDLSSVPYIDAQKAMELPPSAPLSTPAATDGPAPLSQPGIEVPSPGAAGEDGYPTPGTYDVVAAEGRSGVLLYRKDDVLTSLVEMPTSGVTVTVKSISGDEIAQDGYALVQTRFWVPKERVDGLSLMPFFQNSSACWEIQVTGGQVTPQFDSCGTLMPVTKLYNAGATTPTVRCNWLQVTIQGWMQRENLRPRS